MKFRSYLEDQNWISDPKCKPFFHKFPWLFSNLQSIIRLPKAMSRTAACPRSYWATWLLLKARPEGGSSCGQACLEGRTHLPNTMPQCRGKEAEESTAHGPPERPGEGGGMGSMTSHLVAQSMGCGLGAWDASVIPVLVELIF